jgi:hypothetical protein
MKQYLVLFILVFYCFLTYSQSKEESYSSVTIQEMQGLWKETDYQYHNTNLAENGENEVYVLYAGNKKTEITYFTKNGYISFFEFYIGFLNDTTRFSNISNISQLSKKGNVIYCIDTKCVDIKSGKIKEICGPNTAYSISLFSNQTYEIARTGIYDNYDRIKALPNKVMARIKSDPKILEKYQSSLRKEYLLKKFETTKEENSNQKLDGFYYIVSEKAIIYPNPKEDLITKIYIVKDDSVEVIGENGEWVYIKFQGKKRTIEGWIKRKNLIE